MERSKKSEEHGQRGYYLNPAPDNLSGACRVRDLETGAAVTTHDMPWYSPVLSPVLGQGMTSGAPSTGHGEGVRKGRDAAMSIGVSALETLRRVQAATAWSLRPIAVTAMLGLAIAATVMIELIEIAVTMAMAMAMG